MCSPASSNEIVTRFLDFLPIPHLGIPTILVARAVRIDLVHLNDQLHALIQRRI
jgi:hypothetical protein